MYIFDTDHLSLIQRNGQEGKQIMRKLTTLGEIEVVVTVITYEEHVNRFNHSNALDRGSQDSPK
jgi:tRNA(fMet)-specific endonuclease VapC